MMVLTLTIWMLLYGVTFPVVSMNCSNLTLTDWNRIKSFLSLRNFADAFINNGDCNPNNASGLLFKYGACTNTLTQIVQSENLEPGSDCEAAITTSLSMTGNGLSQADLVSNASKICTNTNFGTIISDNGLYGYFCFPTAVFGCPYGDDSELARIF